VSGGSPHEKQVSHYDLEQVRRAFRDGDFVVTARVRSHLTDVGWNLDTVRTTACGLRECDLHKSQAHRERPGVWLDIYRPWHAGERLYVKLTPRQRGSGFVVLSFCRDGENH